MTPVEACGLRPESYNLFDTTITQNGINNTYCVPESPFGALCGRDARTWKCGLECDFDSVHRGVAKPAGQRTTVYDRGDRFTGRDRGRRDGQFSDWAATVAGNSPDQA